MKFPSLNCRLSLLFSFAFGIILGILLSLFCQVSLSESSSPQEQPPFESSGITRNPTGTRSVGSANSTTSSPNVKQLSAHLLSDGLRTEAVKWAPIVYDYCDKRWMPSNYAPCIKEAETNRHLLKMEELVYPDFKLTIPNFINKEYEKFWVERIKKQTDRIRWRQDGGIYAGQHGQNLVFGKGEYLNLPPSKWSRDTCMAGAVRHTFDRRDLKSTSGVKDTIIVATSPDSNSFQHFLDRVTHVLTQGEPHYDSHASVLLGTRYVPSNIRTMLALFGVTADPSPSSKVRVAKSLVFSCRAPLIHPYLSLRVLEKFNVITDFPLEKRKVVMYFSRKRSKNGGRRVVNEDEMLKQVREVLKARNQNEKVEVFDEKRFNSFAEMVHYFGSNVRAIFGPHGGSWYNQRWAGKDTLLIEFIPKKRHTIMFWEEAQILRQNYWPMTLESLNDIHDMQVPVDEVLKILKRNLGKPNPSGPTVVKHYNWDVPQ